MSGIYDMTYEEFKNMCWHRWGIEISQSWPSVGSYVPDHRKNEYKITFPIIDDEGIHFVGDRREYKCSTLRNCIRYISLCRNTLDKEYFARCEQEMEFIWQNRSQ